MVLEILAVYCEEKIVYVCRLEAWKHFAYTNECAEKWCKNQEIRKFFHCELGCSSVESLWCKFNSNKEHMASTVCIAFVGTCFVMPGNGNDSWGEKTLLNSDIFKTKFS